MQSSIMLLFLAAAPPDFDTEVLPVLTRAGCNSGACHGSAAGRGGFKLSLWGTDPAADHDALVREQEGRRVNLTRPERSLLLLKPSLEVSHGGGKRLPQESAGHQRLQAWITAGAARSPGRSLAQFSVIASTPILKSTSEQVTLRAEAAYSDGKKEDVTPWTVFSAVDPESVALDLSGKVRILRPGQHVILARFLERVVPVRLTLPFGADPIDLSRANRASWIDDEILEVLSTLRLQPGPRCDDAAFLRRLKLDLTGTLPTPEVVLAFQSDVRPDKRERLVDALLASADFLDFWTLKTARLLGVSSRGLGVDGAQRLHDWLRERLADGTPLDEQARRLLLALGDTRKVPEAQFARLAADAREQAELTARVFLGVRMQCANCHNHPLDRWTQDDYHGLAAVFARLERGPVVRLVSRGEVIHPRTSDPAVARLPGERFLASDADPRKELASWLTARDNPLFARAAVNRLWRELLGRGLVEPFDDLRDTNPASHPRLLERLSLDFQQKGYDIRHTLRQIALSETYQRADDARSTGYSFYAHALRKPLGAEVLADAVAAVTAIPDRHGDRPLGTRAIAISDPQVPSPALEALGRCARGTGCVGGLTRTLHLINGPLLNTKIAHPQGRLHRLLQAGQAPEAIVEEFYLRALSRACTERERGLWQKTFAALKTDDERRAALEDFLWALLTSQEFTTNR